MLFNNYRPVSLLCVLSKVFEKVMYDRIITFLENLKYLNKNQFGFRNNKSTYMALITLVEKITQVLKKGEYVVGIFLDSSKAFETVDHEISLDVSSKVFEKVMYDRIITFLENFKILNENQFGFWKKTNLHIWH